MSAFRLYLPMASFATASNFAAIAGSVDGVARRAVEPVALCAAAGADVAGGAALLVEQALADPTISTATAPASVRWPRGPNSFMTGSSEIRRRRGGSFAQRPARKEALIPLIDIISRKN